MNPVLKSWLSSVLLSTATTIATWGVAHGLVPAADQVSVANMIVTAVPTLLVWAIAWWKARQVTPAAIARQAVQQSPATFVPAAVKYAPQATIQALNKADNGVMVVPSDAPVDPVDKPLRGPGA